MTAKEYFSEKKNKMGISKYHTNKTIRKRIDGYLERNASIWANLGTSNKLDVGTKAEAKKEWAILLKKIKEIDPIYWKVIKRDND